jgi:hypothetical protein
MFTTAKSLNPILKRLNVVQILSFYAVRISVYVNLPLRLNFPNRRADHSAPTFTINVLAVANNDGEKGKAVLVASREGP